MNVEQTKQRMYEVYQETLDFYDHPSKAGWDPERRVCIYHDPQTGKQCAVGRCLENADDLGLEEGILNLQSEAQFKEEYRGLPIYFWDHLQFLHDNWVMHCADNDTATSLYNYDGDARYALQKYINHYGESEE